VKSGKARKAGTPASPTAGDAIASIKYPAKRKNIPPAGLEAQGTLQETPKIRYEYNPHLPPILRSATDAAGADKLPQLLAKALGDVGAVTEDAFDALSGLASLPFPRPERLGKGDAWRVAVKVIDPRGNEGLRVLTVKD